MQREVICRPTPQESLVARWQGRLPCRKSPGIKQLTGPSAEALAEVLRVPFLSHKIERGAAQLGGSFFAYNRSVSVFCLRENTKNEPPPPPKRAEVRLTFREQVPSLIVYAKSEK